MTDIKSMYEKELRTLAEELGEKPFRAAQLFSWLHEKSVASYDEMTNLPLSFRKKLSERYPLAPMRVLKRLDSKKDGTKKYLFALFDGNIIESVLMPYRHGDSICISSQAGCNMGCAFCASGIGGKERDLLPSEMLEQVYMINSNVGKRPSHIVVMGTGEPFDNYDNLIRFLRLVTCEKGMNISARNITVSTCGIVPKIYALADEALPVTLAISLHAAKENTRRALMPISKKYPPHELIKAARYYYEKTGRRVTFEYLLISDTNSSSEDAAALIDLLSGFPCHVNLIPANDVKEKGIAAPSFKETLNFQKNLEKNRINVTIRREMGCDINGACGQLRKGFIDKTSLNVL